MRGQSRKTVGDKGDDLTQMATYPPSLTWDRVITFFVGSIRMRRNAQGYRIGQDNHKAKEDDHTVWLARQLREAGLTYAQISEKLEVPMFTVRDWVTYRTRS